MNQKSSEATDEMLPEYDFSNGVRGKYFERSREGTNVILLEPDLARVFRDSAAVNAALRQHLSEHGDAAHKPVGRRAPAAGVALREWVASALPFGVAGQPAFEG